MVFFKRLILEILHQVTLVFDSLDSFSGFGKFKIAATYYRKRCQTTDCGKSVKNKPAILQH
jgi:hypothetical protein